MPSWLGPATRIAIPLIAGLSDIVVFSDASPARNQGRRPPRIAGPSSGTAIWLPYA